MKRFLKCSKVYHVVCVAVFLSATVVSAKTVDHQKGILGAEYTIEDLKAEYYRCEHAAMAGSLGDGDIMYCTLVYEELKQSAFDGDSAKLRAWWEANKAL